MRPEHLIGQPDARAEQSIKDENIGKLAVAVTVGAAASLAFLMVVLGIRPDIQDTDILAIVAARLGFGLVMVGVSSALIAQFSGAGIKLWSILAYGTLPFLGVIVLAVVAMAADPNWKAMITGDQWRQCALAVPLITFVPFFAIMGAARLASPANPVQTGAISGLIASAISVIAFALHCTIDPAPLVALWFGGTGILCMLSGAKLAPRFFNC